MWDDVGACRWKWARAVGTALASNDDWHGSCPNESSPGGPPHARARRANGRGSPEGSSRQSEAGHNGSTSLPLSRGGSRESPRPARPEATAHEGQAVEPGQAEGSSNTHGQGPHAPRAPGRGGPAFADPVDGPGPAVDALPQGEQLSPDTPGWAPIVRAGGEASSEAPSAHVRAAGVFPGRRMARRRMAHKRPKARVPWEGERAMVGAREGPLGARRQPSRRRVSS